MNRLLKILFFSVIVRPIVLIVLGLNIRNREKLPKRGPAVIAANHNSHLDALVLMSLYPISLIHRVRPVAAKDYFFKNKFLTWFSMNVIGIIPISRKFNKDLASLFRDCRTALRAGDILIIFPEGSRGQAEEMGNLKRGLFYLLQGNEETKVTPVVMYGLGKTLPKGEALFVPFNCDIVVGDAIATGDDSKKFTKDLSDTYIDLFRYCLTREANEDD